jgi:hypothetical protein
MLDHTGSTCPASLLSCAPTRRKQGSAFHATIYLFAISKAEMDYLQSPRG